MSQVHVWYMSEKERLAYIEKHPIIPTKRPKIPAFSNLNQYGERKEKESIKK
ncbi:hypothetical protein J7E55_12110 [Bacillus sp. ISL-53]|nr:hypothetical protein [Bacillus sp. ISL-53]